MPSRFLNACSLELQSHKQNPSSLTSLRSLVSLLAVCGTLALEAVLDNPWVLLDLLQGYSLIGVKDQQLKIGSVDASCLLQSDGSLLS